VAIIKNTAGLSNGKSDAPRESSMARPRPGLADRLAGEAKDFVRDLKPYLPQEIVGGSIPHIPGTEEEAVWNAVSQACGTEKVHYSYTIEDRRIYFLGCPSASMASNPNSWCPLVAALPGNSEYWDKETVYLYEQEGVASALRWDPETGRMQVFLGASRTILPRVQSMDANFVTINPTVADMVPWQNRNLNTEKLSRATARMLVISGLMVNLIAVVILFFNYIAINMLDRNLAAVKAETEKASQDLMINAYNAMQSDTIRHMVRIQEVLDKLAKVDGTLVKYDVTGGVVNMEALVPPAFAQDFGTPLGLEKDGRVRTKSSR
jgi:hypothetical protein